MKNFKRGDVVVFVAGGLRMLVLSAGTRPDTAVCGWFDTAGHYQMDEFYEDTLVSPPSAPPLPS